MKAIVLVGLPGSGKTTRALTEYVPRDYVLIDDPCQFRAGFSDLYSLSLQGTWVVICDANLCVQSERSACQRSLEKLGYEVSWEFYENNPEAARANVSRRTEAGDNRMVLVEFISKRYAIPEDVETLPVWQPS